jgi:hypothetical protein
LSVLNVAPPVVLASSRVGHLDPRLDGVWDWVSLAVHGIVGGVVAAMVLSDLSSLAQHLDMGKTGPR